MMRRGFGLMYAIIVMVLIATILAYSLNMSSQTTKEVVDEHIKIQMGLYKNSALEYTLLYLSGNAGRSTNGGSVDIRYDGGNYDYNVTITPLSGDDALPESNGTVLVDVVGSSNLLSTPYRIHERRLLKP